MDVNFINPVLASVRSVFTTMGQLSHVEFDNPHIRNPDEISCGVVTGLMSMTCEKSRASISLSFSESAILGIANNFLTEERSAIDCMVTDLVGEFTNMVMGDAKRQLEEKGFKFNLSLPVVIKGIDHLIAHRANAHIIRVPGSTQHGSFCVEAVYETLHKT